MSNDIVLEYISKAIHTLDPKAQAYLFGSRARGDYRPDSDWDIVILINGKTVTSEIENKFRDALYSIELESG